MQKRLKVKTAPLLVCVLLCASLSTVYATNNIPAYRIAPDKGSPAPPQTVEMSSPDSRGHALNVYQRQTIERYLAGFSVPLDTLRILALQTQFADSLMGGQPGSLRPSLRDSTWFANELAHLTDYYRGASRGFTEVDWRMVGTLYTLPEGMKYYGNDRVEEIKVVELAQTLIDYADSEVDFSLYDMVFIIHAGAGQETDIYGLKPEQIWSSFYDLGDIRVAADSAVAGLTTRDSLDGEPFYVTNFSIVPEDGSQHEQTIGTLGIWAFETGNRLGLLPLFDSTPPGFIDSQGIGGYGVMAYGLWNAEGFVPAFPCAFNRLIAGWVDPLTVDAETSGLVLTDINSQNAGDTVCVRIPITENEYYLVVNRVHDENFDSLFTFEDSDSNLIPSNDESLDGAEFDFFLTDLTNPSVVRYFPEYGFNVLLRHTGSGIYIWHVDENVIRQNTELGYLPNDFVARKGVDLEEADGVQDLDGPGGSFFIFGNHFDSFRSGDDNAFTFGPATNPNSYSNGGVDTGILVDNISGIGHTMTFDLVRSTAYEETRVRWTAMGEAQPATAADIDGDNTPELVVLADTGRVYVFNADGTEYFDADMDPATIDPYIVVPGALWTGPPALGQMDGDPGDEIVAAATDGRLFVWKSDGSELIDGDNNPLTEGVLFAALPLVAPPMLLDIDNNGIHYVTVVESGNDSLYVSFVAPDGSSFVPVDQTFGPLWPYAVRGQAAKPLAVARTRIGETDGQTGIVLVWTDSLDASAHISHTPVMWSGGALTGEPVAEGWFYSWAPGNSPPSTPASGDIDADDFDEVVLTTGNVVRIFEEGTGSNSPNTVGLRAPNASAPALGDIDLDGTLEIAVWDEEFMYMLKSNGAMVTNWPRRIKSELAVDQPPNVITRVNETPVVGNFDGDAGVEVIFPLQEGSLFGFEQDASTMSGFPRVGPAGVKVTPTIAKLGGSTGYSLVSTGFIEEIAFFDNVVDTVSGVGSMTMAIQGLPGTDVNDTHYWPGFQRNNLRQGMVIQSVPLKSGAGVIEQNSFYIYPNPVTGGIVHARVTLNAAADVLVEVYNAEGERAFERAVTANPSGLIDTPLDEAIDVSSMKSGVYFMRLQITSSGGTETLVKPFAIRR